MKAKLYTFLPGFMPLGIAILTIACSSAPLPVEPSDIEPEQPQSTTESIDELLRLAQSTNTPASIQFRLQAISELIDRGYQNRANQEIQNIREPDKLEEDLQLQFAWLSAQLALAKGDKETARIWLSGDLTKTANGSRSTGREIILLRAQLNSESGLISEAISDFVSLTEFWPDGVQTTLFEDLWYTLISLTDEDLQTLAKDASSYELRGWIELARVYQGDQSSIRSQLESIDQWRRIWARHSAAARLPAPLRALQETWNNRPRHIALILPLKEPTGNAIQEGFFSAYYEELSFSRDVPKISIFDSSGINSIYEVYNKAIESGVDLVIGPLDKNLVNQIHDLRELPIPTLALNYADNLSITKNLFQFGLAPEDEIIQAIDMAWESGYRNAAVVTPGTPDYERLEYFFTQSWQSKGGQVVSTASFYGEGGYADVIKQLMAINSSEARAEKLLELLPRTNMEFTPRRRNDIDFIFLIANPRQGRQIKPTLAFYFAGNIPVYSMPSIYNGELNQQENRDLDGIVFTDAPWILNPTEELREDINSNLRQTQGSLQRLRAMGIDIFRLNARLNQLANKQINSLRGTTGVLNISDNLRIRRTLQPVYFENGLVMPYQIKAPSEEE